MSDQSDASNREARLRSEAASFLAEFRSAVLSTVDENGEPEASYAPFVRLDDNAFYVYISDLSKHTRNLRETPKASVFLVEDESTAAQIFARKRLTFSCTATMIERETPDWTRVLNQFDEKFGEVMEVLRPMQDFRLYRLAPQGGIFVKGFAQAYRITGPSLDEISHINDVGHQSA
ncbi:MAG: pyridoxamine 5'-phosphate oxidase family protein [Pseudomonadota bacterium]